MATSSSLSTLSSASTALLPRVTIQFCTQCKWMLRAAYFAQELLSTFGTSLGEVALQPSTGGIFIVRLFHAPSSLDQLSDGSGNGGVEVKEYLLWDRKVEGGFPETKELKKRVRDVIDPKRDLGHVDGNKAVKSSEAPKAIEPAKPEPKSKGVASEIVGGDSSGLEKGEILNSRGNIVISGAGGMQKGTGEDYGYCMPGDEDCG